MPTLLLFKRGLPAATFAGAALLAADCGGSNDSGDSSTDASPTAEWADGLCSAISTWTTSISSIVDPIKSGDISEGSLTTAVDDARSATETLTSDLEELGKPDTEAGQEAKDTVDKLSTDLNAKGELQSAFMDPSSCADLTGSNEEGGG